jgi:hypothetical protein
VVEPEVDPTEPLVVLAVVPDDEPEPDDAGVHAVTTSAPISESTRGRRRRSARPRTPSAHTGLTGPPVPQPQPVGAPWAVLLVPVDPSVVPPPEADDAEPPVLEAPLDIDTVEEDPVEPWGLPPLLDVPLAPLLPLEELALVGRWHWPLSQTPSGQVTSAQGLGTHTGALFSFTHSWSAAQPTLAQTLGPHPPSAQHDPEPQAPLQGGRTQMPSVLHTWLALQLAKTQLATQKPSRQKSPTGQLSDAHGSATHWPPRHVSLVGQAVS